MAELYALENETRALMSRSEAGHVKGPAANGKGVSAGQAAPLTSKQMWVDKYRPKRFADLLGEDVSCYIP